MDYPLGHTAGRPHALSEQIEIATSALELVASATEPGTIVPLAHTWPEQWKNKARALSDNRSERFDTPQFERVGDEAAARQSS